ncbi:MAG: hypothetical protein ACPGGK_18455 [Pikeienuella sp.]
MKTLTLITLAAVTSLSACGGAAQYTSGAEYLQRWDNQVAMAPDPDPENPGMTMASALRQAAAVEFSFPVDAKIGLARLDRGRWIEVPLEEGELWAELAADAPSSVKFGTVSPLIGAMTASEVGFNCTHTMAKRCTNALSTLNSIRLGAARQHYDIVIIYETGVRGKKENTGLAFVDLTILGGAILPTRRLKAAGVAKALVMDVRNGYSYATASTFTDLSALSASWGSDAREAELRQQAGTAVVEKLLPELGASLKELIAYAKEKADAKS